MKRLIIMKITMKVGTTTTTLYKSFLCFLLLLFLLLCLLFFTTIPVVQGTTHRTTTTTATTSKNACNIRSSLQVLSLSLSLSNSIIDELILKLKKKDYNNNNNYDYKQTNNNWLTCTSCRDSSTSSTDSGSIGNTNTISCILDSTTIIELLHLRGGDNDDDDDGSSNKSITEAKIENHNQQEQEQEQRDSILFNNTSNNTIVDSNRNDNIDDGDNISSVTSTTIDTDEIVPMNNDIDSISILSDISNNIINDTTNIDVNDVVQVPVVGKEEKEAKIEETHNPILSQHQQQPQQYGVINVDGDVEQEKSIQQQQQLMKDVISDIDTDPLESISLSSSSSSSNDSSLEYEIDDSTSVSTIANTDQEQQQHQQQQSQEGQYVDPSYETIPVTATATATEEVASDSSIITTTTTTTTTTTNDVNTNNNVISDDIRKILIKELKYYPKEVNIMKSYIAEYVAYKKIQRPYEGIPHYWYTDPSLIPNTSNTNNYTTVEIVRTTVKKYIVPISLGTIVTAIALQYNIHNRLNIDMVESIFMILSKRIQTIKNRFIQRKQQDDQQTQNENSFDIDNYYRINESDEILQLLQ